MAAVGGGGGETHGVTSDGSGGRKDAVRTLTLGV